MNIKKVGEQIAVLRKAKGLTQSELGERIGVSFQAVSKWERGEALPDVTLLPDLAKILETTVDFILLGSEKVIEYKGKFTVSDIKKGLNCLKNTGEYLGVENIIYRAAIKGIKAMNKPTVLIGGGYDKDSTYDEWIESFDGKVKLLVLIGQTRDKIAECAKEHGFADIVMADTFEEAMDICIKESAPGDAVLLSPACASWGMFPNYEVRGQIFKEIVHAIKE